MKTILEKLGGTYRQQGNYLLPNIGSALKSEDRNLEQIAFTVHQ